MSLLGMRPGWGGSTEVAPRREDPKGGRGNCLRMLISWDGLVGSGSPGFDPAQLDPAPHCRVPGPGESQVGAWSIPVWGEVRAVPGAAPGAS